MKIKGVVKNPKMAGKAWNLDKTLRSLPPNVRGIQLLGAVVRNNYPVSCAYLSDLTLLYRLATLVWINPLSHRCAQWSYLLPGNFLKREITKQGGGISEILAVFTPFL